MLVDRGGGFVGRQAAHLHLAVGRPQVDGPLGIYPVLAVDRLIQKRVHHRDLQHVLRLDVVGRLGDQFQRIDQQDIGRLDDVGRQGGFGLFGGHVGLRRGHPGIDFGPTLSSGLCPRTVSGWQPVQNGAAKASSASAGRKYLGMTDSQSLADAPPRDGRRRVAAACPTDTVLLIGKLPQIPLPVWRKGSFESDSGSRGIVPIYPKLAISPPVFRRRMISREMVFWAPRRSREEETLFGVEFTWKRRRNIALTAVPGQLG